MSITDLLKNLGRRVTLVDIVEDNTATNRLIDDFRYTPAWLHKALYGARTGTRALLRIVGDMQAGFFTYACTQNPEQSADYALMGALGFATFYFIDYMAYDRINFLDPYKKVRDMPRPKRGGKEDGD